MAESASLFIIRDPLGSLADDDVVLKSMQGMPNWLDQITPILSQGAEASGPHHPSDLSKTEAREPGRMMVFIDSPDIKKAKK